MYYTAVEPKKAYATGRGVQGKGVRVKDIADIMVHTANAGQAELSGSLIGPTGRFTFSNNRLLCYFLSKYMTPQ